MPDDTPIRNARTKAEILKSKADTLGLELSLLIAEYEAANESPEPLNMLRAARGCATDISVVLDAAVDALWN